MTIIYRQPQKHKCTPGWVEKNGRMIQPTIYEFPTGTVVKCECGQTWVSKPGLPSGYIHLIGGVKFRKERWLERWQRERAIKKMS